MGVPHFEVKMTRVLCVWKMCNKGEMKCCAHKEMHLNLRDMSYDRVEGLGIRIPKCTHKDFEMLSIFLQTPCMC